MYNLLVQEGGGLQDQRQGTPTLHHTARARAAAMSYITKDKSSVAHYRAHHEQVGSVDAQTHAHTHTHTHTHTCTHAHTHFLEE